MKINSMRAFLVAAFVILILYALGLFLPIILTSKKQTQLYNYFNNKIVCIYNKNTTFL